MNIFINNQVIQMGNCQKEEKEQESGQQLGKVNSIKITNYVWNKDYQGLFDYDSQSVEKKKFTIKNTAFVTKKGNKFVGLENIGQQNISQSLFRVVNFPNHYEIRPILIEGETYTLHKLLWLVVASLPNKIHEIQQRDILKLGKQKIRIRQIAMADMGSSVIQTDNIKLSKNIYEDLKQKNNDMLPKSQLLVEQEQREGRSVATNSEQICRICLQNGEYNNPLITPCKCIGSVKYIHLNCLKSWLAKRLNVVKSKYCITINWQTLSCEMCKAAFKYRIYLDNKKFYTVDIPKPPKPYIILELLNRQSKTKGKIFHFVSFAEKKKINLGRKKDVDVKISEDISISRLHASIEFNEMTNKFILMDNKSKFGTLILVKRGVVSRPKFPGISVQIGAEVFSFQSKRCDKSENFICEDGNPNQYLLEEQELSSEESVNQSEGSQDENVGENEAEGQGSGSPQVRQRNIMQSQGI